MTTYDDGSMQPRVNLGDLVTVDGYGNRVFRVDAINYEHYRDIEVDHGGFYYETTDVETLELLVADDSEITVIRRAENAQAYLQMNIAKPKPKAELPSIDELLDELSDLMALVELFGETTEYRRKIDGIKAQLKDRTEAKEWKNNTQCI